MLNGEDWLFDPPRQSENIGSTSIRFKAFKNGARRQFSTNVEQ